MLASKSAYRLRCWCTVRMRRERGRTPPGGMALYVEFFACVLRDGNGYTRMVQYRFRTVHVSLCGLDGGIQWRGVGAEPFEFGVEMRQFKRCQRAACGVEYRW
jgi:hypothetical protein